MAARTEARHLVDERHSRGLEAGERLVEILDLEADVMQPGPALVEEPLQADVGGLLGGRSAGRDQLDLGWRIRARNRRAAFAATQKEHVRPLVFDVLARLLDQIEHSLQARASGVAVADGYGDMVDTLDLDHGDGEEGAWPSAKRVRNLYQPRPVGKSVLRSVWRRTCDDFYDRRSTSSPSSGLPNAEKGSGHRPIHAGSLGGPFI